MSNNGQGQLLEHSCGTFIWHVSKNPFSATLDEGSEFYEVGDSRLRLVSACPKCGRSLNANTLKVPTGTGSNV